MMKPIRFLLVGLTALILLLAANRQVIKADVPTFIQLVPQIPDQDEQNQVVRPLPEESFTASQTDKSAWSVSLATAKQIERAVAFRLVLEGQGEVTIDLQLMRSGGVIITEQIQQRFDSNGPHTVTHDIRIPHRLGDLSLNWQLMDKEGTPLTSIESIAVK